MPLASVLTPNQFEAELLTERTIRSEADASAACRLLHERGPHTVVITSLSFGGTFEPLDGGKESVDGVKGETGVKGVSGVGGASGAHSLGGVEESVAGAPEAVTVTPKTSVPELVMLASRRDPSGAVRQWRLRLPQINQHFTVRALHTYVCIYIYIDIYIYIEREREGERERHMWVYIYT